ncbi:MAG: hypothetical protein WCS94_08110 [Verrucomicrobiota bacterium]
MGRTYIFECPQCQYRAQVSGGADGGIHCEVQTVICRDCRQLFDVVLRVHRRAGSPEVSARFPGFSRPEIPPVVLGESSINPSPQPFPALEWQAEPLACPAEPKHFVEPWNDPGRCPRCGNFLEKNGLPFRLWD